MKIIHCNSWAPLHASGTIVRLMHSIKIKQAPSVNRHKGMGTGLKRIEENWPKLCNNQANQAKGWIGRN